MKRLAILLLLAPLCYAQSQSVSPAARKSINAGNQAWVDAMKTGDVSEVAATYTDDAVDCGPTGDCEKGRAVYEQKMKERIAKLGRASSASVSSAGSVQQGDFVYEWGSAKAEFANGRKINGRYLTVWQRQPDDTWKIFRNLSIPADEQAPKAKPRPQ